MNITINRSGQLLHGLIAGWLLAGIALISGAGWTQYRGPNHDGVSTDPIIKQWPVEGPRQLWRTSLNAGFSSFAVSQDRAYTLVRRFADGQDQETCVALHADTGEELWATPVGLAQYDSGGDEGDGPRSTPSVDGNSVYVLSAYLRLYCLDTQTGAVRWSKDLVRDYGGSVIPWQNAASPLIDGDRIFVNCNGSSGQRLLALYKADGRLAWKGQNDKMTHATPVAANILGVRQVIFFAQSGLVSVVPETGVVLWRYPFSYSTSSAASPVVGNDIVYCSAAYGRGAGAVKITKSGSQFIATEIWRNQLANHWSTPVYYNGYLYGLFGSYSSTMPLKCIELATGRERWSKSGFGAGGILIADGQLLVLSEGGDLVLVAPNPNAYTQLARYQAVWGKCWNSPAISNGRIYARSVWEGVCLNVSAAPPPRLRLHSIARQPDGRFQLIIGAEDGTAVEAGRLARIEILATTDLNASLAEWSKVTSPLALSNGQILLDDNDSPAYSQRFYMVVERP
jgi:outer membrane protein assembly factor BamB